MDDARSPPLSDSIDLLQRRFAALSNCGHFHCDAMLAVVSDVSAVLSMTRLRPWVRVECHAMQPTFGATMIVRVVRTAPGNPQVLYILLAGVAVPSPAAAVVVRRCVGDDHVTSS